MTWKSNERSSSDCDYQQGSSGRDNAMDDRVRNSRDLSSDLWKRDSGCGGGGCSCGCCHGGFGRPDRSDRPDPRLLDNPKVEEGMRQISQILQDLGVEINLPTLWPRLTPDYRPDSNHPTDSTGRTRTIDVSNGDTLTLGARGETGPFKLVDKDGMPVHVVKMHESMATDSPIEYELSNGAVYRTRGGWNHDESITWPNGDVVRFSDAGKFQSFEPGKGSTTSSDFPHPYPDKPQESAENAAYIFSNGDQFVTTSHGWELYTVDGQPVTKGKPDTSAADATRIPLSNGATLTSGGWGVDTISYPGGESISFNKDGTLRTVNGQPA